jgi:hypothetical protein
LFSYMLEKTYDMPAVGFEVMAAFLQE